jgi:DNA helicase HerA-like ATPase
VIKIGPKRKYISPMSINSLPRETENAILLGEILGTDSKAYFDADDFVKHAFVVGGSGTGKSMCVMAISEECLHKDVSVVVFDTKGNWREVTMKNEFIHEVIEVSYTNLKINILKNIGRRKMAIFDVSNLTENDYNEFVRNSIEQMVYKSWETVNRLKILMIFEDAYKLSPRFGGQAAIMLEKACRELRKFGIGILLITHSYSDFGPAVLGNVNTEFWFKTSHEEDLQRIKRRFGPEYVSSLVKLRVGECMVSNVDYNYSKPWFVKIKEL